MPVCTRLLLPGFDFPEDLTRVRTALDAAIESVSGPGTATVVIDPGSPNRIQITSTVDPVVISDQSVAATAAGQILHAGGNVVAFVPNTFGRTLVHSSAYGGPSRPLYGHRQAQPWNPPEELERLEWGER